MIHKNLKLSTSNAQKIRDYKSLGLQDIEIIEGKDLKEVHADSSTVALYKAIEAGTNILVEDSILVINGEEIVDIRWKLDEIATFDNPKIQWIVNLSILDNGFIYIYQGISHCDLVQSDMDPFGPHAFDPFLRPKDTHLSFYDLDMKGRKADHSPRTYAVNNLLNGDFLKKVALANVPEWTGDYQS